MSRQTNATNKSASPAEVPAATAPSADAQKEAMMKVVALFNALELPVLATGAAHQQFAQDLIPLGKIQARKVGAPDWKLLFSSEKKDEVAKIPASQQKAMFFTILSFLQTPRTDRGYAYVQWAAANKALIEKYLGDYEVMVTTPKGTLPVIVGTIKDLLAGVEVRAKILLASVAMQAPTKSVGTRHSSEKDEYDLVL